MYSWNRLVRRFYRDITYDPCYHWWKCSCPVRAAPLPAVTAGFRGLAEGPLLAQQNLWLIHFLHHCSGMSSIAAQSPELCKAGKSTALYNAPSAEQPVPSGPEAGMEAGACFGSPVMPPGEAVAAANPWQRNFVTYSDESNPCLNYCLPLWWGPYSTTEVSGSVWTPGIEG